MDAETKNRPVNQDSIASWLTLRLTPGVGNTTFHTLLNHFGHVEAVLTASHKQLSAANVSAEAINALTSQTTPDISADLAWLETEDHHILTLNDAAYPTRLKQLNDAPPLLYVRGDIDYLQQPQLAMVGSRNPTAAGRNTAKNFATHLSDAGITITSGLADGIDGASHEGALLGLAGTIAVVAHGLDIIYPAKHQQLAQKITENGAVISEMPIGIQPRRGLFPRRNRLISALSLGTLVVEAAYKSGSLITARYAMEQNSEVFAIPGSIHNPMARGCHQLIRQGAKLVETAKDILEELNISQLATPSYPQKSEQSTPENPKDHQQALDPDHQKLLKCLAYEPASIDELVLSSQFSAAEIASMLLILELEDVVVCQNGRYTNVTI
ncbi:Rossmann fold nucleotide-binding protein Smf possibly involved in DNA uptake [hydrothermal vent metagenome]|uniref:Rossmann fold nucleotide-binding protein Smf possibly involved in DNA uptake n=1 Tax=hydrothermal vent metagenome TaxID=652676 RepID=A0A3B0WBR5_9ZZZZ